MYPVFTSDTGTMIAGPLELSVLIESISNNASKDSRDTRNISIEYCALVTPFVIPKETRIASCPSIITPHLHGLVSSIPKHSSRLLSIPVLKEHWLVFRWIFLTRAFRQTLQHCLHPWLYEIWNRISLSRHPLFSCISILERRKMYSMLR